MKVGYLGPQRSFTYQAAGTSFATEDLVAYPSIPACLKDLEAGFLDFGVVPLENSLEGSVHATIDSLFHRPGLQVVREIILPIKQQLLMAKERPLSEIHRVLSHPQALAQSQTFLEEYLPQAQLEAVASTTHAAQYVQAHPEEAVAAIASKDAAGHYGLAIAQQDIQDNAGNQTRFWVVARPDRMKQSFEPAVKQTLLLTLPSNQPGALYQVLQAFGWRKIDLSKIESRPLKTSLGEYFFVVDLVCDKDPLLIANAITEIQLLGATVQNLGAYPITLVVEEPREDAGL